ncbi:hypothetical protein TEU_08580 [Thermococcus eurythermalis]|uniref:Uncharacterized protein n=1 Tax=Thermococcus eurythermalis TaxID=1505907 RepID=A0A097QV78_9EURY|nr:class III signal peptide-containing protein [Thermococcus eurythermalis]AIU70381.1 hypothetical protein TEU_08580 [Thermococcus eurythermalis]
MKRSAQASIEYVFMVAIALVLILLFLRTFFDPRTGTVRKVGKFQNDTEAKISDEMDKVINEQD